MGQFVKWADYDDTMAAADDKRLAKSSSGGPWMKMEVGENVVRIVPSTVQGQSPFRVVDEHRVLQPGDKFAKAYECPGRADCGICSLVDKLYKRANLTGDANDKKAAGEIRARKRVYANVIDRNDEAAGPKRWSMSVDVYNQIQEIRSKRDGKSMLDPKNGFDLIVTKIPENSPKNQTTYPKFSVQSARSNSPLGDEEQQEIWFEHIPSLADAVAKLDPAKSREIAKALASGTPAEAAPQRGQREIVAELEPPRRQKTAAPSKPSRSIVDDEDDLDLGAKKDDDDDDMPF